MYCSLKEMHKVARRKMKAGATTLGTGSFGSVRSLKSLPDVSDYVASVLDVSVEYKFNNESNKFSKLMKFDTISTKLNVADYTQFIKTYQHLLVAKYFKNTDDLVDEFNAVENMIKTIHPKVLDDTTILYVKNNEGINKYNFCLLIDVFGQKFLLYKQMNGDLENFNSHYLTDVQRKVLFYRLCTCVYTFLFHSIGNGYFHRDIKPANILFNIKPLSPKEIDYDVKVGDFGMFTNKPASLSGTPNYMCVMHKPLKADQVCFQKFGGSVKIATLANEMFAYTSMLLTLAQRWRIGHQELERTLSLNISIMQSPAFVNFLKKSQSALDSFNEGGLHPIYIYQWFKDTLETRQIPKPESIKNVFIADNSIFSNIGIEALYKHLQKNKQTLISFRGIKGNVRLADAGITMHGPFAYTFIVNAFCNLLSYQSATEKDFLDYYELYVKKFKKN